MHIMTILYPWFLFFSFIITTSFPYDNDCFILCTYDCTHPQNITFPYYHDYFSLLVHDSASVDGFILCAYNHYLFIYLFMRIWLHLTPEFYYFLLLQ